ncbi:MAG: RHS repeat-associated core domain-containing protein [Acidimicrobiales bacterium]
MSCFYDPTTGQFISRDPANALTRSAYGYTGGNPLNRTDPSGLWTCDGGLFCDVVNGGVSLATGGSADCLTNMTCNEENTSVGQAMADEFKGDHPAAASGVVDSASGALSVNPITAATNAVGATDTGQCGNSSSWWYHGGQAAMILTDLWAGTGAFAGPLSETEAVGKGSTLFGRGGGLLNSNDAVRLGWGWSGSALDGQDVFRLVLGNKNAWIHWHLDIWEVGPAL